MAAKKKTPKTLWVEIPTPYQMCQRYASGTVGEADLVAYLATYDYAPPTHGLGPGNPLLIFVPSSEVELDDALHGELISSELHTKIVAAIRAHQNAPSVAAGTEASSA